jgi:hypothetical protein
MDRAPHKQNKIRYEVDSPAYLALKFVYVPVAQRIERFPAEEEVSRSNRLGDANFNCATEAEIEVRFLVGTQSVGEE